MTELITILGIVSWIGISIVFVKACKELATVSQAAAKLNAESMEMYANLSALMVEHLSAYQAMTTEVIKSYEHLSNVNRETAEMSKEFSKQAGLITESVTSACRSASEAAAKTCHELLHSAFPEEKLNWNWHSENSFMCYYCQQRFPLTELDQQGGYSYCKQHGEMRRRCS